MDCLGNDVVPSHVINPKRFLANKIHSYINLVTAKSRFGSGQSAIMASRLNYSNLVDLWDAEVKVYSQWGEDGIIDYLCESLRISKPKILEIGAGDFTECNSRFACEFRNASVFAVDGRPELKENVSSHPLKWKTHLFSDNQWVTPENVIEIERRARSLMSGIDIVSLDLDGNDYWILDSMGLEEVSVVIVEYNPLFGHDFAVTVPRKDGFIRGEEHWSWLYYGASLKAFVRLLIDKDFTFIGTNRVGNNAFFVSTSKVSEVPIRPAPDFQRYTDWRIRESRSEDGKMSFSSGDDRMIPVLDKPLIDVITGKAVTVRDAIK